MSRFVELRLNLGVLFGKQAQTTLVGEAHIPDMELSDSALKPKVTDGRLALDLTLEQTRPDGTAVLVRGNAKGRWVVACRRCLRPTTGDFEADIEELFEANPRGEDSYRLVNNQIDLRPMLREAALLSLPFAPLCGPQCQGPEPTRFPTGQEDPSKEGSSQKGNDERWAALGEITFGG